MRKTRILYLSVLVLALALVAAACSSDDTADTTAAGAATETTAATSDGDSGDDSDEGGETAAGEPRSGGVLRVGHTTDVQGFHPDIYASSQDRDVITNIYDSLVEYDLENYDIVPSLATSWSVSDDGLIWTFELETDVTFHDGSDFTADDVVFSVARAQDPTASRTTGLLTGVTEVVAVDDQTVEIHLDAPDRVLLSTLVDVYISPSDTDADLTTTPIGTGPFMLSNWERNQFIELVKNPDFWQEGLPYLDGLTFRTVPELNVLALQLRTGEIDLIYEAPLAEIGPFQAAGVQLIPPSRVFSIFNMYVNTRNDPWTSEQIRQAASYAIDRQALSNALFGFLEVRSNPLAPLADEANPGDDFFNEDAISYDTRDLDKAIALVAEAGYDGRVDGGEMIICSVAGFQFDTMAQLIQSQLAEAGIDVKITPIPDGPSWASRQNGDRAGEFDLSLCGMGPKPDSYDLVNHTYAKFNTEPMGWIDQAPDFYERLAAARSIVDDAEYQQTILDLQAEAMAGQPNILLGGRPVFVAALPTVRAFVAHTQAHMFFTNVWLDEE